MSKREKVSCYRFFGHKISLNLENKEVDGMNKEDREQGGTERLGFLTPKQARENYLTGLAKCA